MNRRGFLGGLAAFAAACAIDPELSAWKPSSKLISIPKAAPVVIPSMSFAAGDIITIGGRFQVNPITREATDELQRFVITREVKSQSRFDLLPLFPPMLLSGQYQNTARRETSDAGQVRVVISPWGVYSGRLAS